MSTQQRLNAIAASVFGVDAGKLTDADSPKTIAQWDSVSHLEFVFAVEAEFGIQFPAGDIAALTSLGAIRERLSEAS
jgi:acyl carrier protein